MLTFVYNYYRLQPKLGLGVMRIWESKSMVPNYGRHGDLKFNILCLLSGKFWGPMNASY